MFKFTIRELLLVTAIIGLAVGWRVDHRALAEKSVEVVQDARALRHLTMPRRTMCGQEGLWLAELREKYDQPIFDEPLFMDSN